MIERAIAILQQAGFDLTARELAEIIWLAVHLEESEQSQQQSQQFTVSKLEPPRTDQPETQTPEIPELASLPQVREPRAEVYLPSSVPSSAKATESREAIPIKVPAAIALRNALALGRALRPLMRKVPSPTENILDEEATVCRIAEEKIWVPVLKPAPERWLELALVVEQSSSTAIWKQTITELQRLLKHHGAFRDVRTWELKVTETKETKVQLFPQNSTGAYDSTPHSPNVLIDPKGQRLILLVSDCISPAWRKKFIHPLLKLWGSHGLITILQLLPEQLWERTALASEIPVQLHSLIPGVFNSQLIIKTWDKDEIEDVDSVDIVEEETEIIQNRKPQQKQKSISVPVVTLEPHPLRTWSRVIAGLGNVRTVGFKFSSVNEVEPRETQQSTKQSELQLTAPALVSRFRATASPLARRLAGLMAAAPVSLPVVLVIQQTLLPQSSQIHVAEVFMSGLLKPQTPIRQDTNSDYIEYEFVEGVRQLLLESVPVSKTISVIDNVSEFVAQRLGLSVREFEARLLVPASQGQDSLETKIRPFAQLKAQVLRQLGGDYVRLAEELEEQNFESSRKVDYTRLRDLLAAGNWKQADEETVTVMLQAAGQEKKGVLETKDIDKFPCEDLSTINQLWGNYSQGRFGFSVQKQIYQSLGGTIKYNQQTWEDFGDHVGWRRNSEWIDYTDFTFSLDAPLGHLPTWVELFQLDGWGYRKGRIKRFLSRIESCNLSDEFSPQTHTFEFDVVTVNAQGREINREKHRASYFTEDLGDGITLEMVAIPGGKFLMGSPEGEGYDSEKPQHEVTVQPFFMGKYPVTQAQWRAVAALPRINRDLNPDPSHFKGDNRPVECVSWYDAVEFYARLSRRTGREYRLPSEAEWEYACRAGTTTPFHFGETITYELANYDARVTFDDVRGNFDDVRGNFDDAPKGEYQKQTTPVGTFPPNAFGLYDMHGNVWEWCADHWHEDYSGAPTDTSPWREKGNDNQTLLRSGSWYHNSTLCRSAYRFSYSPSDIYDFLGCRVVCNAAFFS